MTSVRPSGLLLLLFALVFQHLKESSAEKPSEQVEAVSGWTAELPCRVRNVDTPLLVLWYRGGQAHPFYSFDARGGNLSAGEGGVHDLDFGPRSSFELSGGLHLPSYSLDLGRSVGLPRTRAHASWERQPEKRKRRKRRKRRWDEKLDWPEKETEEEKPKEEAKGDAPISAEHKGTLQKRGYNHDPYASEKVSSDSEAEKDSKKERREQHRNGETKRESARDMKGRTEGEGEQQEGQRPREEVEGDLVVDFKSLPIFPGTLHIRNVDLKDAGGFHCRVDFLNSPTRNHRLNLTVYELPRRISVVDGHGQNLETQRTGTGLVVGPLDEGASLLVVCNVFGGSPAPSIQWLKNGKVIRDDVSGSGGDGKWSNTLFVHQLKPEDQESTFSCRVANNNLTQPNITNVNLDMNIKPSSVRISGISGPIDAGSHAEVMCTTSGSRPQATITWTLGNDSKWKPTRNTQSHTMKGDTVSSIVWTVRPGDDKLRLTCIATNPRNPQYQRSNYTTLIVHHAPETNLVLGRGLDPKTIKEGVDVYFDCHVKANPPSTSTVFFHQGVEVTTKSFPGAILSGLSLALQKVKPSMAGEYSCKATNAKGSSTSEIVNLEVMHKPVCRTPKQTVTVSLGDTVTVVDCAVDAFPQPTRFAWSLNDTTTKGGLVVALPPTQFESRGDMSRLQYSMPENAQVVELFCWATNALGNQQEPCTIKVFAPGNPKQVQGCTMEQRKQSLVVSCQPGVEGAVDQTYQAQLRLSNSDDVIANVTSRVPSFSFDMPEKGLEYVVYVYSLNVRYRSPPVVLEVSSLKVAENRMNSGSPDGSKGTFPLLTLFVGVIAAFLLTLAVILAATKLRCSAAAAAGTARTGRSGGAKRAAGGGIVGLEDTCDSDDSDDVGRDETSVGRNSRNGQTHMVQVEAQPGSHSKESVGASSQAQLLQNTSSSIGIQQKDSLLSRDALRQADDATVYKNASYDKGFTKGYNVLDSSDHALGSPLASSSSQFGVAYSGETVGLLSPSSSRSHLTKRRGISMGPTPLLYGTLGQPRTLLPQHHTHSLGRQPRLLQETGARSNFESTNNRRMESSASSITRPAVSSTMFLPAGVRVLGGTGLSTIAVTVRGFTSLSPVGGSSIGGGEGGGSCGEVGLTETGASGTASSSSASSQYKGWSEGGISMAGVQLTQGTNSKYHALSLASAAASTTTTTTISARRANESFV